MFLASFPTFLVLTQDIKSPDDTRSLCPAFDTFFLKPIVSSADISGRDVGHGRDGDSWKLEGTPSRFSLRDQLKIRGVSGN